MKVTLDKNFPIDAPAISGWKFLQDIPGVAGCMPGAEITEAIDDRHYKGQVKAKIGPATMAFNGDIEIQDIDSEKRAVHLIGRGQDTKGTSSATMDLKARILDGADGGCVLEGEAQVAVTGKAASLGGRMMTQVADQILNQFGKNFANNVVALGEGDQAEEAREELSEQPKEVNGLAFAWAAIVGFFRSLFGLNKASSN